MATAQLRIENSSGIVLLTDSRKTMCFLGKVTGGAAGPTGTKVRARGPSNQDYCFGYAPSASSYGLTLRDGTGALLFDAVSYGKMIRPVGTLNGSIVPPKLTETKSLTLTSGRTYAVWHHSPVSPLAVESGSVTIGGVVNYFYYLHQQDMSVSFSGAQVSVTATRTESTSQNGMGAGVPYDSAAKYSWRSIIIDVTGY